jgi:hypothetical protein
MYRSLSLSLYYFTSTSNHAPNYTFDAIRKCHCLNVLNVKRYSLACSWSMVRTLRASAARPVVCNFIFRLHPVLYFDNRTTLFFFITTRRDTFTPFCQRIARVCSRKKNKTKKKRQKKSRVAPRGMVPNLHTPQTLVARKVGTLLRAAVVWGGGMRLFRQFFFYDTALPKCLDVGTIAFSLSLFLSYADQKSPLH